MIEGSLSTSIASDCMKHLIEKSINIKSFEILSLPLRQKALHFLRLKIDI